MNAGYLSDFFKSIGWKRLAAVEANAETSKQHEFNGSKVFLDILGTQERRVRQSTGIPARMLYFNDDEPEPVQDSIGLSWYNARAKPLYLNAKKQKRDPEWRLFYQTNAIIGKGGVATEGDLLIIAFAERIESAVVIVAKKGSTVENQLVYLFGIEDGYLPSFQVAEVGSERGIDLLALRLLEALGIEAEVEDDNLEELVGRFEDFPSAWDFSEFARQTVDDINPLDDPDMAVVRWIEQEEVAFRLLEKRLVQQRLGRPQPFDDVDDFISFSLSVHNRRKSRAGSALENHLCELFCCHGLAFSWRAEVESRAKPDFLFPTVTDYNNLDFTANLLTLLGAKTTCKDRWRQVLSEGRREGVTKHLLTLEPAISENQICEMQDGSLQLVVPASIHETYPASKKRWVWNVKSFLERVKMNQLQAGIPDDFRRWPERASIRRPRRRR